MKGITRLGFILAAFSVVACVALAAVNALTEETIAAQAQMQLEESLKSLFAGAEQFEDISAQVSSPDANVKFDVAYAAKKGGVPIGAAVKAHGPSYGGDATVLVGLNLDKTLAGARVLETKDTPGLGANAVNPSYFVDKSAKKTFPDQFTGKALSDPFEVKKDVVAITASTITSRALTKMVKTAADAAATWLESAAATAVAVPAAGTPPGAPGGDATATPASGGK